MKKRKNCDACMGRPCFYWGRYCRIHAKVNKAWENLNESYRYSNAADKCLEGLANKTLRLKHHYSGATLVGYVMRSARLLRISVNAMDEAFKKADL